MKRKSFKNLVERKNINIFAACLGNKHIEHSVTLSPRHHG